MASQINVLNIDAAFPVAGKDNSSQGFRDNFANIKLAFTTATTEISNLQLYTAKLNESNDFAFSGSIQRALIQNSGEVANTSIINGAIDYTLGNYHKAAINTNTTFTVSLWPDDGIYAKIRLEVTPNSSSSMDIDFDAGIGTLLTETSLLPYTSSSANPTIWDVWTTDGGTTVFVQFVGGPFVS